MVLEQLLDKWPVVKYATFSFLLGFAYVFIAYGAGYIFFPSQSLVTVLLAALLLVPSLHHLIGMEEEVDGKGSDHWWDRNKPIIRTYTGAFLGLLAGFCILGFIAGGLAYQEQQLEQNDLKPELVTAFKQLEYLPSTGEVAALFSHNLLYFIIMFILSLFYGAGAVFLIVFNASYFAAFVHLLASKWPDVSVKLTGASLTHLIPESLGFIFAAISGGILSYAVLHEKVPSKKFKNVIRNCTIFLGLGILFVLLAAFIEVYFTAGYFSRVI